MKNQIEIVKDIADGMYGIGRIPNNEEFYAEFDMRVREALGLGVVMGSILSVANGWGEASTFYKVGSYYEEVEIAKIQQETKVLGAGYYNDLTINCYVGYSGDGKKLFEINDGANVEVRYCP